MRMICLLLALTIAGSAVAQVRENIKQRDGTLIAAPVKPKGNIRK